MGFAEHAEHNGGKLPSSDMSEARFESHHKSSSRERYRFVRSLCTHAVVVDKLYSWLDKGFALY